MSYSRAAFACSLLVSSLVCGGCASFVETLFDSRNGPTPLQTGDKRAYSSFGLQPDVYTTVAKVRDAGAVTHLASRAVRLPKRPVGAVTAYEYQLPQSCGSHRFRVYEFEQTQILEYLYDRPDGGQDQIRDYVEGPSAFIKPGLWTSFDHTRSGMSQMRTDVVRTRSNLVPSVYSRGLVSGLAEMTKHDLDVAYRRALIFAEYCDSSGSTELVAAN